MHTEPAAQLRRQEADQALQGPRAAKRTDNRGKGILTIECSVFIVQNHETSVIYVALILTGYPIHSVLVERILVFFSSSIIISKQTVPLLYFSN